MLGRPAPFRASDAVARRPKRRRVSGQQLSAGQLAAAAAASLTAGAVLSAGATLVQQRKRESKVVAAAAAAGETVDPAALAAARRRATGVALQALGLATASSCVLVGVVLGSLHLAGVSSADDLFPAQGTAVRKLVHERMVLLFNAWMTSIGHQRPGVAGGPKAKPGLPLPEAKAKAAEIGKQIDQVLAGGKP